PIAGQDVPRRLSEAGPKTTFPKRAASFISPVEILHIALSKVPHELGASRLRLRSNKQMHVIRHQAVGVNGTTGPHGEVAELGQVSQVVAVLPEASCTVVAALNDVDGHARKGQP